MIEALQTLLGITLIIFMAGNLLEVGPQGEARRSRQGIARRAFPGTGRGACRPVAVAGLRRPHGLAFLKCPLA
jgi:hypothetical protein